MGEQTPTRAATDEPSQFAMVRPTTSRLGTMHRNQVRRAGWPEFEAFDGAAFSAELRRSAAHQWAGRARAEHGSIHQFTQLAHALCDARLELELLGSLARLITDEVRHAELCATMAQVCAPPNLAADDPVFSWPAPEAPWEPPPTPSEGPQLLLGWAARVIAAACCIGETLSRPMLDAIVVVATEPVAASVARQILRDEHLHAAFGWEAMAHLVPMLDAPQRAALQAYVTAALGGVEETTACGISIEDVAGTNITISASDEPNLGTLTDQQYAMIFYATIEAEVLPGFDRVGLDAAGAWANRPR